MEEDEDDRKKKKEEEKEEDLMKMKVKDCEHMHNEGLDKATQVIYQCLTAGAGDDVYKFSKIVFFLGGREHEGSSSSKKESKSASARPQENQEKDIRPEFVILTNA